MKKLFRFIIPTALMLGMLFVPISSFADSRGLSTYESVNEGKNISTRSHQYRATRDLNVRATPSGSGEIIGWLSKGDVVWLDPDGEDVNGWLKIYGYNSKGTYVNGYVASRYIDNIS